MAGARKLQVDIVADASGVRKGTAEAEGRFAKMGSAAGKAGRVAGLGLAAIGVAAAGMAVSSVKAASDVEQTFGALETVFGKGAGAAKKFAKASATTVGLSSAEYARLSASVGTSLKIMGNSMGDTVYMTDDMIKRASDLSATFGGDTASAVEALGSAFRGEFDSIEKFGLNIKASDIQTRLAAEGMDKHKGESLKAAQAQVTYDLIMEKSKDTMGAFNRESGTLAHQQQVLSAQFENVKAAVGARLIPVLVRAAEWFQQKVMPAAARLGAQLRERLAPMVERVGVWFSTKLIPALRAFGDFIMQRVVPVVQRTLTPIIEKVRGAFQSVSEAVGRNSGQFAKLRPIIELIGKVIAAVAPKVGALLGGAFGIVGDAIGKVVDLIGGLIGWIDSVARKFDELWAKVQAIGDKIAAVGGAVGNVLGKLPGLSLEVTPMIPAPVVGPVGGLGPALGVLATAAAADPLAYSLGAGAGRSRLTNRTTGTTVNMPITINGALDPVAVARQLEAVLRDATIRLGRSPAFGW